MKLFGLTGGIGMGKSTAAKLLAERGLPVLDTDTIAREIVAPGQPALAEITARFGPAILTPDGHLDRARLADLVFADSAARQQLEAILHPRIRAVWIQQTEIWRSEGRPTAIVVIPLLFETAAETSLDATVCIACSPPPNTTASATATGPPTKSPPATAPSSPPGKNVPRHLRHLDRRPSRHPRRPTPPRHSWTLKTKVGTEPLRKITNKHG